jgi:hypothetical protein
MGATKLILTSRKSDESGSATALCRRAHGFGDQMNRIERSISYDAGIVPQFNGGKVVDPVDADHNQRALISVNTNSFTTTWNARKCHARDCSTFLP